MIVGRGLRGLLRDGGPVLWGSVLLLGYVALYGSWQFSGWGLAGGHAHVLMGDALVYPVDLAALAATFFAARRVAASPRLARAWRFLFLGALVYLLGEITYNVYDVIGIAPYPSLADGFYLAFYPLLLAGLLSFPVAKRARNEERRVWMDIATVALAFSSLVIYLTLDPNLHASASLLQTVFSIAYPVGDMLLLAGIAAALLHGSSASARLPLRLLGAAFSIYVVGDLIYGVQALHGTYQSGDPVDILWIVTFALVAAAALWQRSLSGTEPVEAVRERVGRLPFASAAGCFGVMLYAERANLSSTFAVSVIGIAVAALLALRLYLGQRDLIAGREELRHQALYDSLTDLPNRVLLRDRLDHALARRARDHGGLALLIVDLDDFKAVNDTNGHGAGDRLLVEIAGRLRGLVRTGETFGRLGGDEFCVLAEGVRIDQEVDALARRVLSAFTEPFSLDGKQWYLTVSVGGALANGKAVSGSDLLRDADTAMYRAKAAGPGCFELFDTKLRTQLLRRVGLTAELKVAIAADAFELAYQPIIELADGEIIAFEQLVRWHSSAFGTVAPGEFIPLAEQTGLIVPLGRLLFERAAVQAAYWRSELPGLLPRGIGVNVSARELEETDFAAFVAATLARHGLTSADIALELTERVFIDDHHPIVVVNLGALSEQGFGLTLDDFGSGYSALSSLKRFPLRSLKIDRFFTAAIRDPGDDGPVIRAVVGLGKALDLNVIAEGIETQAQLNYVRAAGVDQGQGYLFAKPLSPPDATEILRSGPLLHPAIPELAA